MSETIEAKRHAVARAIHLADYASGCVDIEIEWDANEDARMRQADAALEAAGVADLLADLADMDAYIRQRDDAMRDLEAAEDRLRRIQTAAQEQGVADGNLISKLRALCAEGSQP